MTDEKKKNNIENPLIDLPDVEVIWNQFKAYCEKHYGGEIPEPMSISEVDELCLEILGV